ncbi:MAG: hypothetical protein ABR567_00600 [Myxococcales bacterium]|nr:hypothetical protein [Myxococcales bacterium]
MRAAALLLLAGCASAVQAPAAPTARFPKTWSDSPQPRSSMLAVLDFRNKIKDEEIDAAYFSNAVRAAVKRTAPSLKVMTRENVIVLLQSQGKTLDDCEGECEIDTGRRLGADYVVSGELLRVGASYKLDLRLHETRDGQLVGGVAASGHTVDELDANTGPIVTELLSPLR